MRCSFRPNAIADIINRLRLSVAPNASPTWLPRNLLTLLQVVKELSTGRLQRNRTNLQSMAPEIVHVLANIYLEKSQRWKAFIQNGGDDEGGAVDAIEQSLLAIKALRRALIVGYEFPNRNKEVEELWLLLQAQWNDMLVIAMTDSSPVSTAISDIVAKHLMQFAKLHLEMIDAHPAAFVHLPKSLDIVRAYWQIIRQFGNTYKQNATLPDASNIKESETTPEEKSVAEKLSIKGMLVTRACLRMIFHPVQTFKYRHAKEKEEKAQAIALLKQELYTPAAAAEWMREIIAHFFVFRQSDLHEWEEEPEEWEMKDEKEAEGFEFSMRASAEKLFLDLIINYRDILVEPLLSAFYVLIGEHFCVDYSILGWLTIEKGDANADLLTKESMYTAIGLAAPVLSQKVDFDQFIATTLVNDIQKEGQDHSLLRRRVAILLGQWISVNVSEHIRPTVYQIFQFLLNPGDPLNDQVVRITAAKQFKAVASEWEFKVEHFLPYAPDILSRLMALIQEVALTETKMSILETISMIVERMEHHVRAIAYL